MLAQGRSAEFDATHLYQPVDLGSTWLVQGGDDPTYARPDFDDSHWITFNPNTSITTLFPDSHPEVVWYRQRIKVDPAQTGLALKEQSISRAFEVYVNGERLITSGQVSPYEPCTVGARVLRRIPDRLVASGTLVIAVRAHITGREWTGSQDPGYFATNLTLGQESTLDHDDWLEVISENLFGWLDLFLLVSLGVVALVLFSTQRSQFEYLWIFALALSRFAEFPFHTATLFHDVPVRWQVLSGTIFIATPLLFASIYFGFIGLRIGWGFRTYLLVAGLLNAYSNLGGLFPFPSGNYGLLVNLPFITLLSIVFPIVFLIHLRRGNREAGILLIPIVLFSLYIYARYGLSILFQISGWRDAALRGFALIDNYRLGPFTISLNVLSEISSTVALAIIMLLRSSEMSRRQAVLEGELAAAQQVQELLLPKQIEAISGFAIESVYQPAQQVGGDFFQILPTRDNGLLLVVGDVAGKGLPAAMLVSLLVGAIRTAAEDTHDPAVMLSKLNERLVGRFGGGFSTALAAHISPEGTVTIANAGHLSPYLDGREIELPGALPLGIVSGAVYETIQIRLTPGNRLTFYSDGVIEAQNPQGELFGFERGREISTQPAAEIAEAAKQFGQSDDITVVAITRTVAIAEAA